MAKQKYKKYTNEKLSEAVDLIKRGILTNTQASKRFDIPRKTLGDYLKGKSTLGKKGGQKPYLTPSQDSSLANYVRTATSLARSRVAVSSQNVIDDYFTLLNTTIDKLGLTDKPAQIWNADEAGFGKETEQIKQKIIATTGTKNPYRQQMTDYDHITVSACASAAGPFIPNMLIYTKSLPSGRYASEMPSNWIFSSSENGYITRSLFEDWFSRIDVPTLERNENELKRKAEEQIEKEDGIKRRKEEREAKRLKKVENDKTKRLKSANRKKKLSKTNQSKVIIVPETVNPNTTTIMADVHAVRILQSNQIDVEVMAENQTEIESEELNIELCRP
ncbi:unnamed protein product [Mytilus edulis]|uniref:HTH psq-type domain-containing protein n=1 Tax=Mytilus edulis TaxID=6550 RepID=A0A8S3UZU1_MYTED|nr:unnamed protein product [Mytilus edulis]